MGFLSKDDTEKLLHAFNLSRLYYSGDIFSGRPGAAALVLTNTKKMDQITALYRF